MGHSAALLHPRVHQKALSKGLLPSIEHQVFSKEVPIQLVRNACSNWGFKNPWSVKRNHLAELARSSCSGASVGLRKKFIFLRILHRSGSKAGGRMATSMIKYKKIDKKS
jgi:hypothetical protein